MTRPDTREDILSLAMPIGWQLVPIKPDAAMRAAVLEVASPQILAYGLATWETMLAAAPTPPAAEAWHDSLALDTAREVIREYGYHHSGGDGHKLAAIQCIIGRSLAKAAPPAAEAPGQEPVADEIERVVQVLRDDVSLTWEETARKVILALNRPTPPTYADAEVQRLQALVTSSEQQRYRVGAELLQQVQDAEAKWHDEQAVRCRAEEPDPAARSVRQLHERHAANIRSLASPAPKGET